MLYSILEIDDFACQKQELVINLTKKQAIKLAKDLTKDNRNQIFVCWTRLSDGQEGYLNPNGDHAVIGVNWNTIQRE